MTDETVMIKGELHYVRPHLFWNGNSSRCDQCRYFAENEKQKEKSPFTFSGECHSKASEADRTNIFTRKTMCNYQCRWWFPIEKQEGENETIW